MASDDDGSSVVVEAVASMTAHGEQGASSAAADLNAKIQAAMVAAIIDAQARGVTDVEELRAVQIAARDKVLAG